MDQYFSQQAVSGSFNKQELRLKNFRKIQDHGNGVGFDVPQHKARGLSCLMLIPLPVGLSTLK